MAWFYIKEVIMNTKEKPFFARYLEGQDFPNVKTNVKAGGGVTQKFPSDDDEGYTTLKYPSDTDEPGDKD
jgi:hypothetical protein